MPLNGSVGILYLSSRTLSTACPNPRAILSITKGLSDIGVPIDILANFDNAIFKALATPNASAD